MGPQPLYIRDQVPGRVRLQARIRGRFAATTLIEEQEVVSLRIELAPMLGRDAAARSAMQEQGRLRSLRSASLEIDLMAVTDVEHTGLIGVDGRIERALHRCPSFPPPCHGTNGLRSDERSVWKKCVRKLSSWWSP